METITESLKYGEILLFDMERLNHIFIDDAIEEWDMLEGNIGKYPLFLEHYRMQRWFRLNTGIN